MQNIFIEVLPPWVETGLQPAFYDLESGTVLQQTARMWAKMRELGVAFNTFTENVTTEINNFEDDTNAEIDRFERATNDEIERFEGAINDTVEDYIEKFNALKNYVDNYFDNLDVQEEINNKLDDMLESGQLQEIIDQFVQSNVTWTFDNVSELTSATNLINGSYARTLGYYTVGDGGGAFYLITDTQPSTHYEEVGDSLYAKLLIDEETSVDQYGAKGDGTTDDTSIIQEAIDELSIVNFGKKTYLVSSTLTVKDNLKLIGDETKFKIPTANEIIKYSPNATSRRVYTYTVTGNEGSDTLFISVDGDYYGLTLDQREAGDILYLTPDFNTAVWQSADKFSEREYTLSDISTGSDITSSCTIANVSMPSTYLTGITIKDIAFNYDVANTAKYAIYIKYGKNITLDKCSTSNSALIWVGLDTNSSPEASSLTTDVYAKNGYSQAILNDGITITNCNIVGTPAVFSSISYTSSGIYFQYCKNCRVEGTYIAYFNHGVSIWGGNVGSGAYQQSEMIPLCDNLSFVNNKVYTMKMGGIWSSRASNIIVNTNNINICGDVGIDFEGSFNCVADSNIVNNCQHGNLATLYGSCECVFSNNTCIDEDIVSCVQMVICNNSGYDRYTRVIYDGNTFKSYYKAIRGVNLLSAENGKITFTNNMFCNTYINKTTNLTAPYLEVYNNNFTCTPNCDLTNFTAFINLAGENRLNSELAVIKNNVFDVAAKHATAHARLKNNSRFDGKYAIIFDNRLNMNGYRPSIIVEGNEIYGFNRCILLNHTSPGTDTSGRQYIYLNDNLITGPVENTSDNRGFIIPRNNKSIYGGDNNEYVPAFNYPNAIPTDSTHGGWLAGTRIDFDTPTDGYTSAICTVTGQPGTWKKFGATEA